MVLDDLIEVVSKLDTQQAIALVDLFPFPEHKATALSVIAQSLAHSDPMKARDLLNRAAELAQGVPDPDRKASAWRSIAVATAIFDVEQALKWAKQIHDPDWRNWTLGDIASVIAKRSVEEAIKIAQQIEDIEERSSALADIAIALAQSDLENALTIAREISDPFYRVQALSEIAQISLR
jgi:hypothetical protein